MKRITNVISRDQSPRRPPPTPPSAWSISIIERIASHRIASRRVATMHPWGRNAERRTKAEDFLGISRVFASPSAANGKKKSTLKFSLLYPSTLVALLDSRSRSVNHPSLHRDSRPRRFFASFVISSFSFLRSFQPVILFHTHTHTHTPLSFYFSFYLPIPSYHSRKYIHTYIRTRMHTSSLLPLSSRYRSMF